MLAVIGFDGATFDVLSPWLKGGYLPNLARLMAQGTHGPLESTLPPITASAWASFMTGKNPGQHSVFDFFRPTRGSNRLEMVNSTHIQAKLLWEYLSEAGLRVGVLNVPVTHPPRPVNGYLVPGLLSPNQGHTTWPPNLLKPYQAELGYYQLTPHLLYHPGNEVEYAAELLALIELQLRYALQLLQDHPTHFFMLHFLQTDIAQHAFWKHHDPTHPAHNPALAERYSSLLRNIFIRLDEALGQIMAVLPPNSTIMLMSDHGFGPQHHTINLNNYFIETGLMTLKTNASTRWRRWAFKHNLTPNRAGRIFARLGLRSTIQRIAKTDPLAWPQKIINFNDVDWSKTVAYSGGHLGQVYLNVAGREAEGIVSESQYQQVRDEVSVTLQKLRHPQSGQPLISQIIPREEAAAGPYLNDGPDLHLIMDDYRVVSYPLFAADGRLFAKRVHPESGNHRREGIFVAAGPHIAPGKRINQAKIEDLAPTILHLFNLPIPNDMTGRVLEEGFSEKFRQDHPISYQQIESESKKPATLSPDEQATVEERLRALGYLG